jgi:putative transposase
MSERKPYPSDLNDPEWELVAPLIPPAQSGGRPREVDMREVLNAIFYVLKSGCQWDMLPHDFPPKGTVYHYFNTWRKDGTWAALNDRLREQLREELGREATPSAASIDSQSVKTTEKGGPAATMVAKKSKDANGISSSIPKACCSKPL